MHVGVGCGAPPPSADAAKPKLRDIRRLALEIDVRIQPSTRTTHWCFAHRCRHLRPLRATIPGQRCCHRIPATGFRRTDGCPLCCHRRRRPRYSAAPASLPARWSAVRARPKPRSSCMHPASVREPDRTHPPALLGTSSRQAHLIRILRTGRADVAADANSSSDPRFVAVTEPRCRLVRVPPHRSELQCGGGRHEHKCSRSPSKRSHKRMRPMSGVRTPSSRCCHRAAAQRGEDPELEVHRAGEPEQRATRPYERRSTRSCPTRTRRCRHHPAPAGRRGSEDPR